MKKKKQTGMRFKEIVEGFLYIAVSVGKLVWLVLLATSLIRMFGCVGIYLISSDRYNAANYENQGLHTLYFKDIEFYTAAFALRGTLGIRYKINYETTIGEQIYVYSLDDYKTKNQAIKMSEENPTQTKYIYSVKMKDRETLRLSEFATAEELVHDLSNNDRSAMKYTICLFVVCILAFVCYKIIERKNKLKDEKK